MSHPGHEHITYWNFFPLLSVPIRNSIFGSENSILHVGHFVINNILVLYLLTFNSEYVKAPADITKNNMYPTKINSN
jgi:hypothetical protein